MVRVLSKANIVSKYLQKVDGDVKTATNLIKSFFIWIYAVHTNGWKQTLKNTKQIVQKCNENQLDIGIGLVTPTTRCKNRI